MKSKKFLLPLIIASCFAAGVLFAEEAKKEAAESKPATCCAKAEGKGEKCGHGCCAEAAKAEKNCEKCNGSGKIEKKPEEKK
ncbi:hypothetical protein Verru16b_02849 [Lacunisphaera limnophila]|uniref:Uncharacterized protein n=1 Tax=Lacunisphaera limnophila TaxID=1838286 RepID=A0A1D8AY08_9BACT|nr:hypothetical protein [Lacunisphaera limnophila]AOS45761.1 hypothetical protein Verru16b_02849 [Lacunisphaera limnophila]